MPKAFARRNSRKPLQFLARHVTLLLLGLFIWAAAPQTAAAQAVDWVLNVSDTDSDPTPAGGLVDYRITVTNDGYNPAPATMLDLAIPAGTVLETTSGAVSGCAPLPATGPATITCPVPALESGASVALTAHVRTAAQGTIGFTASVPTSAGGVSDSQPGNNSVTENTSITAGADISLTLSGPDSAMSGQTVTYGLAATNNGPDPARNLVLDFPVPSGLAGITAPAGCTLAGGAYRCTIAGPVAVGATVTREFQAQIVAASGSTITPAASIGGGTPADPIPDNNGVSRNTQVEAGSDLAIAKSRAPGGTILVGDQVTFTLTPRYSGDSPQGITVTDTLPANYSIVSTDAPGWIVGTAGQTVTATRPSGSGAGANVPLGPITIVARADAAGSVSNTAQIAATAPDDPNPANNTASDGGVTIQAPQVDLRANPIAGPWPRLYVVGQSYEFGLSGSNVGNAPFVGTFRMTSPLPAGMTVTALDLNGWTCSPGLPLAGPADLICEREYTAAAPLAPGAETPVLKPMINITAPGPMPVGLTVGSPDLPDEPNMANNTITSGGTAATPANSANLRVIKTADPATVASGDQLAFLIEIVNDGPSEASSVTVTDELTGLINNGTGSNNGFVSLTPMQGNASGLSCTTAASGSNGRRLSCTIDSLPVCTAGAYNDCPRIGVIVRPGGNAGARTNTATAISADTPDPALSNNSGSANYNVTARADVTIGKLANPATPAVGQPFDYVITARNLNHGMSQAQNVTVTDTLPAGMTFISAMPSNGSCSVTPVPNSTTGPGNDTVTCNLGTINVNAQRTVTISMRPDLGLQGTAVTNLVTVSTTTPETDTTNNSFSLNTNIADPQVNLLVNKTDSVDPLPVGDNTVYRITVTNSGPSVATDVVVTDEMPAAHIAYLSHTVPGDGTCSTLPTAGTPGGQLACNFPLLEVGDSRVIEITAQGLAKGVPVNRVEVASEETRQGFEPNLADNVATQPTTLRTRADVEVTSKTSNPTTVNLRETFDFIIDLRNISEVGLDEADDVTVTDTLPAGIELSGAPTVTVLSGSASSQSCTGTPGETGFTCSLGTLSSGAEIRITAPSRVVSVQTTGQVFTNTAEITTSSFEANTTNNSNSGTVTVNASSLGGRVFRDFDNNAAMNGGDTAIGGLDVTLSGTAFDGTPVTRTIQTAPDGSYDFTGIPAGTYSITHAAISETDLQDGITTAGSAGGNPTTGTIDDIALPAATPATGYLFPKVPQARIGIAKSLDGGPVVNADGSFTTGFNLIVQNPSLEPLEDIRITDPLSGAAPFFGSFAALADPTAEPLAPGSYTIVSAPSGSCGGANGGFNGASDDTVASGFTLAAGAWCEVGFQIRVRTDGPLPAAQASGGNFENIAQVEGTGEFSGQTRANNPSLTDRSNDGTTIQWGVSSPTPLAPVFTPSITLVKSADSSDLSSPPAAGDRITYNLAVTNTGNVTLTDIAVADPMLAAIPGSPVAMLAPGESQVLTAVYELTQADLDAGHVENTATVEGEAPDGTTVTDISGTDAANDDPTIVALTDTPGIALVKTADTSGISVPALAGDRVTYNLTVTNTGNVTLTDIAVADPMLGAIPGSPVAMLAPGESQVLVAVYELTQADLDAGGIENTATAEGQAPDGGTVTDISGTDTTNDNPTVTDLTTAPAIALLKAADASGVSVPATIGDEITYAFTVTNTGNVTLTDIAVTDPVLAAIPGSPVAALAPGESQVLTAVYELTQTDIDRGEVENTATTQGEAPDGTIVEDISGTDMTNDDPTLTPLVSQPAIALVKAADASGVSVPVAIGDEITFAFTVTNTGNVTLTDIAVADPMLGAIPGSPVAALAPGESQVLTAVYELTQADIDAGQVENTATAQGRAADGRMVDDTSGTDTTNDDPTVVALTANPSIALVKVADTGGISSPAAVGDEIGYRFTVTNTGNVTLHDITLVDTLEGVNLTGGPVATLVPGAVDETTFAATYELTQADIDAGEVRNSASVIGTPRMGEPVNDISGATIGDDDATVVAITPSAGVRLVKSLIEIEDSNGNGLQDTGDTVRFGFSVINTGNVALRIETIEDATASVAGGPVTIGVGETDTSSFAASHVLTQADLDRGHVQNTATVNGLAVRGDGSIIEGPGGAPLQASAISDAGTDPEGRTVANPETTETPDGAGMIDSDPGNDPTVARLTRMAGIELIKNYAGFDDANGNGVEDAGDTLTFTFAVTNTGNVALRIDMIDDPTATVAGGPVTIAPGQTDSTTFTATYLLDDDDMRRGYVQNSARVTGQAVTLDGTPIPGDGGAPLLADDISDAGTDPDGNLLDDPRAVETPDGEDATDGDPANDPTVVRLGWPEILLQISILETPDMNGNGIFDAGDQIVYAFDVTNTGNVALENVSIDPDSLNLNLPGFSCQPVPLEVGATARLLCTGNRYTVTAADAQNGSVGLSATATGHSVAGVSASSDHAVASPMMRVGGLTLAKSADRSTASAGDLVGYTLELGNDASGIATVTDLVDTLPAGFTYRSRSATVGDSPMEPEIHGNRLIWRGLHLAAGETLPVRIEVLIGSGVQPGAHVNRAQAFSPTTGQAVTPEARATIRVEAEAVFACSTVIGRVFDDLNHDGYYNGEPSRQSIRMDAPLPAPRGVERGLPGVRLITPNGLAVTTDRHGRFSLPCAALPRDIGANFMLKLDERTLPAGYRLTTENPRVVRLTPGMLTKMNFGATLSQVVRVDLSARAFDGHELRPELHDGLRLLVTGIAAKPSVVRLSYQLAAGEDRRNAQARLHRVEAALRRLWPANGRFALNIETVVATRPARAGEQ